MSVSGNGGLYSKVKVSVKSVNIVIICSILILIAVTAFTINNAGFYIEFDTVGGSHIETSKLMYGDKIDILKVPTKQGYEFTGWYLDKSCTVQWDIYNDTVTGSMKLYAGWK